MQNSKFKKNIILALSSFFYIGFLPFIPGTFGSIAGVFLFLIIKNNAVIYTLSLCLLTVLGFLVCGEAEHILHRKDAPSIVIDEVSGILLGFMFIPFDYRLVISGFILFRLLDTLKPFPAGPAQKLKGALGIMSDDIIAGLYTNVILQAVFRFASFRTS